MERPRPSRARAALVALILARRAELGLALLFGLAAFLLVVGPAPLDPTNIAWLSESDAATNYLGWAFYRAAPWSWPPAANPAYGLDIAGSVMMADANPLLAMPFKLLSSLLPTPFQYFGLWLLACFLLQATFGHAIAARFSGYVEQRLAVTALFLFAPCFLIRIATPAMFHMTLCGQWQILAALWLYLSPDLPRRAVKWTTLLTLSVLTHPYLLAAVALIWLADLFRLLLARARPTSRGLIESAMALFAMVAAAKLSGVFWLARPANAVAQTATGRLGLRSYGEWGFGYYKANLLSPFDPENWSWLLPDLPSNPGEIEGFAFLGLGVLLLLATAIPLARQAWLESRNAREHVPLVLVLAGLMLFAVTPNVAVGTHVLHVPWPAPLLGIGNLFRSSGRFVWPLVYCAMAVICWTVARGLGRRAGSALLLVAALLQIADSSAGWRAYATTFARHGRHWPNALTSSFWRAAGHRYTSVRLIVPRNRFPDYREVDNWALANGMTTDLVYLARYDAAALEAVTRQRVSELRHGRLSPDTLWITDGVAADALARMPRRIGDRIGIIDGIPIFAPAFGDEASLQD